MNNRNWGRILAGTRLEKQVEPGFVIAWSQLIKYGLREGDGWAIEAGKLPHRASNALVRKLLKSDKDSLFMLDSDADIGPSFLNEFRDYEPGWQVDALQAFYVARGWPPEPVWFKQFPGHGWGRILITDPDCMDTSVGLVGTHCALFRREIFEKMLKEHPDVPFERFEWFYYPRNDPNGEDTAFSLEMERLGFTMGATTHLKAGHIVKLTIGWETYMQYVLLNKGKFEKLVAQNDKELSNGTSKSEDSG